MSECHDGASNAPRDRATTYARFTRVRNGVNEELRVGAEHYNGFDYASIRLWTPGVNGSGDLYPSKMGVSLRRNELVRAIGALQDIARDMGLLGPDAGEPAAKPKTPPDLPASQWQHYGGKYRDGAKPKPDATVDHTALYAGQGRRRVDLSEACRSAAFQMLVNPVKED